MQYFFDFFNKKSYIVIKMSLYKNNGKNMKLNILFEICIILLKNLIIYILIVDAYIVNPRNTAKNKYSLNSFSKLYIKTPAKTIPPIMKKIIS